MFPEYGVPLILGMVIFPREGNMNTCSVMETQGIEGSVPVEIEQHDSIDLIKELDIYSDVKAPYNSQNLDQFSADDRENRLWPSMFVVAALVLIILLMLRALKAPKKLLSKSYCSNISQSKIIISQS